MSDCALCGKWFGSSNPAETLCISCKGNKTIMGLVADRDRWKARAEALERALRNKCVVCSHDIRGTDPAQSLCDTCLGLSSKDSLWQFDEARFAGGKDGSL